MNNIYPSEKGIHWLLIILKNRISKDLNINIEKKKTHKNVDKTLQSNYYLNYNIPDLKIQIQELFEYNILKFFLYVYHLIYLMVYQ